MKEGEQCSIVLTSEMEKPAVVELDRVLREWVNKTLEPDRIIVKDLKDDFYDGHAFII